MHKHTHKPTDRTDYDTLHRSFARAQCKNKTDKLHPKLHFEKLDHLSIINSATVD